MRLDESLFVAAMIASLALLLAYVLPWWIARLGLALSLVGWFVLAVLRVIRWSRTGFRLLGTDGSMLGRGALVVGVVGVGLGAARNVQLGLIQTMPAFRDISFNIDHRYIFMHAWSLLRFEGTGEILSMAGTALNYHTGPAWHAAAVASLAGLSPQVPLFLMFPLAAVVTISAATIRILRAFRIGGTAGLLALAFATTPTWTHLRFSETPERLLQALYAVRVLDPATAWRQFEKLLLNPSSTMMLNSLLAAAVMLAAAAFAADNPTPRRYGVAALCIACAALAKPQYFAGGPPVLLAVAVASSVQVRRVLLPLVLSLSASVAGLALSLFAFGSANIFESADPAGGVLAAARRGIGTSIAPYLPGTVTLTMMGLAMLGLLVLRPAAPIGQMRRQTAAALAVLAGSMVAFSILIAAVVAVGGEELSGWAWDAKQAFHLPSFVGLAVSFGLLVKWAASMDRSRVAVRALTSLVLLGAFASAHQTVSWFADPIRGHDAIDSREIRELLRSVPVEGSLLITSDLADPASGNKRDGRAFYLSNRYGHQFWLSQTVYELERRPEVSTEVERRRSSVDQFFTEPWSDWHAELLWEHGVTHILISERCPSSWDPSEVPMLELITATGLWTAWSAGPPSAVWPSSRTEPDPASAHLEPLEPAFGRGACR